MLQHSQEPQTNMASQRYTNQHHAPSNKYEVYFHPGFPSNAPLQQNDP